MTPDQVAVNHKAITAAAERLEARGWQGPDAARFVESLLLDALASGFRRLEPPPPLRPAHVADDNSPGRQEFRAAREALGQRTKEKH